MANAKDNRHYKLKLPTLSDAVRTMVLKEILK